METPDCGSRGYTADPNCPICSPDIALKTPDQIKAAIHDAYQDGFNAGKWYGGCPSSNTERALIEALAHLETLAKFGGTADQARELAKKGVTRTTEFIKPK